MNSREAKCPLESSWVQDSGRNILISHTRLLHILEGRVFLLAHALYSSRRWLTKIHPHWGYDCRHSTSRVWSNKLCTQNDGRSKLKYFICIMKNKLWILILVYLGNICYKTDFITIKLAFKYHLTIFFWKQTLFLPSKSVVTTLTVLLSIDLEPKKILGDNSAMQKSSLKGCCRKLTTFTSFKMRLM